ncbi:MAG: hypothetical protein ACREOI_31290 [bacterium]
MKIGRDYLLEFCLTLSICFNACHTASRDQNSPAKDFTIIFGSGGGFTGMAEGYIIHSDGKIEKWSGLYFRRDKLEISGMAQPATLQPLWQMFEAKTFSQWSHQRTGNMTTQVWCISGSDTTVVSWPGLEPGKDVPQAIQDFYDKLMLAVRSANK